MNIRRMIAQDAENTEVMKKLEDKTGLPFKKKFLADEVRDKLDKLIKTTDWNEKSTLLEWAIDSLRSEILDSIELGGHLQEMSENEQMQIMEVIDSIQQNC